MTASIVFLGDTLLGGDAQETLDRECYAHAFGGLAPPLSDADLVVANHESPITASDKRSAKGHNEGKKRRWYGARPGSAQAPADAGVGVGVVSLANNHALDFGLGGRGGDTALRRRPRRPRRPPARRRQRRRVRGRLSPGCRTTASARSSTRSGTWTCGSSSYIGGGRTGR